MPEALGVKVTQTSQLNPCDNDAFPQKLFSEKSPVIAMPVMLRVPEPMFLMFTSAVVPVEPTAADPKSKLEGVTTTVDAPEEPAPVPVSVMDCGLPVALSLMVTDAEREPVAAGLKVTLIVQLPILAATEFPQLFVCAKSPLFAPVKPIPVMLNAELPVLVSVTDCEMLVAFKA
jgi:hypothetical protein